MSATHLEGFAERSMEIRGVRLRFFVGGTGDPVILVHGLGGAASNYAELAVSLARRRAVLVPDLPGHGGSTAFPAPVGMAGFVDRVELLARRVGLWPAGVVGHSFGGPIGLRLALRAPDGVTGLVLAGSAGFSPSTKRAEQALLLSSLLRPGRWVAPHRDRVARSRALRRLVLGWGAADVDALSATAVTGFLAGLELHTDTATAARALIVDDVGARFGEIRAPVLVLWGTRDRQTPIGDAYDYARRLRAELRTIPGCGHLLIGERADACAQAIDSFLDGVLELDEAPLQGEALG